MGGGGDRDQFLSPPPPPLQALFRRGAVFAQISYIGRTLRYKDERKSDQLLSLYYYYYYYFLLQTGSIVLQCR